MTVMGLDNGAGNGKSESQSTVTRLDATHALLEGIENSWQYFRLNPDSIVADTHNEFSVFVGRLDMHRAAFGRELDCLLNHVPPNLHQAGYHGISSMWWPCYIRAAAHALARD